MKEGFGLEIIKVPIKQDQVAQGNSGKIDTKSKKATTPFDQILALFNTTGGLNESDGSSTTSTNASLESDKGSINPSDITIEDWEQLEAILAAWINGLQQVQSTTNSSQSESNLLNQQPSNVLINQINQEGMKNLGQWFQKISQRENLGSPSNPDELLKQLALLLKQQDSPILITGASILKGNDKLLGISEGEDDSSLAIGSNLSNGNDKVVGIPKGVEDKFKLLVNLESKVSTTNDQKPQLILDKNLVPLSNRTDLANAMNNGESKNPSFQVKEQTKPVTPSFVGVNPYEGNGSILTLEKAGPTVSTPTVVSIPQFAPEISDWATNQLKITNNLQGSTEAKFSLYPEHLGQVDVKITSHQGQISAEIITNTLMGKEALDGQLQHLKHALQQHGFQVQKIDISYEVPSTTDSNAAGFTFSDGGSYSNPSRDQSSSFSSRKQSKEESEQDAMLEIEKENPMITYGGPSGRAGFSRIDFTA